MTTNKQISVSALRGINTTGKVSKDISTILIIGGFIALFVLISALCALKVINVPAGF